MAGEYVSNVDAAAIGARILEAEHCAILTHAKPDGDALGSTLALARSIRAQGGNASIYLVGPLEEGLRACAGDTPFHLDEMPDDSAHDLAVIVDTGSWSQLDTLADWIRNRHGDTIVIDHHRHGDDVGAMKYIRPDAASASMVLLEIFDASGLPITPGRHGVAEALFLGLGTDTGWFRHGNADAAAFAMASRLLALDVEKDRLYQLTDQSYPPRRLLIEARALSSLQYLESNRVAIMTLSRQDFEETGTKIEELTGIVNMPLSVATVRVSILLTEVESGRTKISFRSKAASPTDPNGAIVDVNVLAQRFDGGGHKHAAGARIDAPIEEAVQQIVGAVSPLPVA